ncbi:MAG: hypothetical protein ACKVOE_03825 [Rickettsiales bacterium]
MDTQNQNSAENAEPAAVASPPSRRDGLLTLIVSVAVFSAVGAWLGHKMGKAYVKKSSESKPSALPRTFAWVMGVFSGLLALGSQPKPQMLAREHPFTSSQEVTPVITQCGDGLAPRLEIANAQAQGKITPDSVREQGVQFVS